MSYFQNYNLYPRHFKKKWAFSVINSTLFKLETQNLNVRSTTKTALRIPKKLLISFLNEVIYNSFSNSKTVLEHQVLFIQY